MYLTRAKQKFKQFCQEHPGYVLEPCSQAEIKKYEEMLDCKFPNAYKEFLEWMGKDTGGFMCYYFFRLSGLPRNKEDALELMHEDEYKEEFPEDAIVFAWGSDAFDFFFIRASEGDDPPIHHYWQGKGVRWNAFSNIEEFVITYISSLSTHEES
jgi:hypothetical protein